MRSPAARGEERAANVVLISPGLAAGGKERVLLNAATALVGAGHQAHVVCLYERVELETTAPGVQILHLSLPRARADDPCAIDPPLAALLARIEAASGVVDLVLSNSGSAGKTLPAAWRERWWTWAHFDYRQPLRRAAADDPEAAERSRLEVRAYYQGERILVPTRAVGRSLVEVVGVEPRRLETVAHPFPVERIRALSRAEAPLPERPYLVWAGRFDADSKRPDLLLDAYRRLADPPPLVLLTTRDRAWPELIERAGLDGRVIVAGFRRNPFPWLRGAELTLLSSDYEAYPNVIAESLICGTPVVSTDCPSGPRQLLRDGLERWLVPPGDAAALAARIAEALVTEIEIPETVVERFRERHFVEQLEALAGNRR